MAFDWQSFLDSNHIHYVTSGANVSRGHVAVKCPFCGTADPSEHMSVSLQNGAWHCWRNDNHAGVSPVGLVQALLRCTWDRARTIVGESVFIPEDFLGTVQGLLKRASDDDRPTPVLDPRFKAFTGKASSRRFVQYLRKRDYTARQIERLSKDYGLCYATQGPFRDRVIFPVTYRKRLITYTGRTIHSDVLPRYKTLSYDEELVPEGVVPAFGAISDYLLFFDQLKRNRWDCDTLIICEGPFDALKVSVLGRPYGIDATCVFTSSPSQAQIDMLADLVPRYKHCYLMLDRGTLAKALRSQIEMQGLGVQVLLLPENIKDPGELTLKALLKIVP